MKRKEYRQRQTVTLSAEKDRWHDFEDLCDKERKSVSLKVAEMIDEELQKNALGERTPISIAYGKQSEKPLQPVTLDDWMDKIKAITEPEEAGRIEGFHKTVMQAARNQFYELKARRILRK